MEQTRTRGRPRKYATPEEAKAAKHAKDRARPNGGHIRKIYPRCCRDAQSAKVTAEGSRQIEYKVWAQSDLEVRSALSAIMAHWRPMEIAPGWWRGMVKVQATVRGARITKKKLRKCDQHRQWTPLRWWFIGVKPGLRLLEGIDEPDPVENSSAIYAWLYGQTAAGEDLEYQAPDDAAADAAADAVPDGVASEYEVYHSKSFRICQSGAQLSYRVPEARHQRLGFSNYGYDKELERDTTEWLNLAEVFWPLVDQAIWQNLDRETMRETNTTCVGENIFPELASV